MEYWISLDRKDKSDKESSLHFNWMTYTVYRQEYWVNMYVVEIQWDYFNNASGIWLTYMSDEYWGYWIDNMDLAKYSVECYLTYILHYNFEE